MSDLAQTQPLPALMHKSIALMKSGYFTLHNSLGIPELTDSPVLGYDRWKINLVLVPLSFGTNPIGDCIKNLKGTSSKDPAYLLAFTSVITLFQSSILLPTLKVRFLLFLSPFLVLDILM